MISTLYAPQAVLAQDETTTNDPQSDPYGLDDSLQDSLEPANEPAPSPEEPGASPEGDDSGDEGGSGDGGSGDGGGGENSEGNDEGGGSDNSEGGGDEGSEEDDGGGVLGALGDWWGEDGPSCEEQLSTGSYQEQFLTFDNDSDLSYMVCPTDNYYLTYLIPDGEEGGPFSPGQAVSNGSHSGINNIASFLFVANAMFVQFAIEATKFVIEFSLIDQFVEASQQIATAIGEGIYGDWYPWIVAIMVIYCASKWFRGEITEGWWGFGKTVFFLGLASAVMAGGISNNAERANDVVNDFTDLGFSAVAGVTSTLAGEDRSCEDGRPVDCVAGNIWNTYVYDPWKALQISDSDEEYAEQNAEEVLSIKSSSEREEKLEELLDDNEEAVAPTVDAQQSTSNLASVIFTGFVSFCMIIILVLMALRLFASELQVAILVWLSPVWLLAAAVPGTSIGLKAGLWLLEELIKVFFWKLVIGVYLILVVLILALPVPMGGKAFIIAALTLVAIWQRQEIGRRMVMASGMLKIRQRFGQSTRERERHFHRDRNRSGAGGGSPANADRAGLEAGIGASPSPAAGGAGSGGYGDFGAHGGRVDSSARTPTLGSAARRARAGNYTGDATLLAADEYASSKLRGAAGAASRRASLGNRARRRLHPDTEMEARQSQAMELKELARKRALNPDSLSNKERKRLAEADRLTRQGKDPAKDPDLIARHMDAVRERRSQGISNGEHLAGEMRNDETEEQYAERVRVAQEQAGFQGRSLSEDARRRRSVTHETGDGGGGPPGEGGGPYDPDDPDGPGTQPAAAPVGALAGEASGGYAGDYAADRGAGPDGDPERAPYESSPYENGAYYPEGVGRADERSGDRSGDRAGESYRTDAQPSGSTEPAGRFPQKPPFETPENAEYSPSTGIVSGSVPAGEQPPRPPEGSGYELQTEGANLAGESATDGGQQVRSPQARYRWTPTSPPGVQMPEGAAYDPDTGVISGEFDPATGQPPTPPEGYTSAVEAQQSADGSYPSAIYRWSPSDEPGDEPVQADGPAGSGDVGQPAEEQEVPAASSGRSAVGRTWDSYRRAEEAAKADGRAVLLEDAKSGKMFMSPHLTTADTMKTTGSSLASNLHSEFGPSQEPATEDTVAGGSGTDTNLPPAAGGDPVDPGQGAEGGIVGGAAEAGSSMAGSPPGGGFGEPSPGETPSGETPSGETPSGETPSVAPGGPWSEPASVSDNASAGGPPAPEPSGSGGGAGMDTGAQFSEPKPQTPPPGPAQDPPAAPAGDSHVADTKSPSTPPPDTRGAEPPSADAQSADTRDANTPPPDSPPPDTPPPDTPPPDTVGSSQGWAEAKPAETGDGFATHAASNTHASAPTFPEPEPTPAAPEPDTSRMGTPKTDTPKPDTSSTSVRAQEVPEPASDTSQGSRARNRPKPAGSETSGPSSTEAHNRFERLDPDRYTDGATDGQEGGAYQQRQRQPQRNSGRDRSRGRRGRGGGSR